MGGLQQAWDWIKDNWVKLLPALLGGPFGIAASGVWIFWDEISAMVDQALGWVRDNWVKLLPAALIFPFIGLPVLIAAHWDTITGGFREFSDTIIGIWNSIWGGFETFGNWVTETWDGIDPIGHVVTSFQWLRDEVKLVFDKNRRMVGDVHRPDP